MKLLQVGPIYLSVNKEKIGLIVGEKGKTKKKIEELLKVKININSKTGEIVIKSSSSDTTLNELLKARDIIRAISLGFPLDIALNLLHDEYFLDVIDLKEHAKSRNALSRIKGRIIGERGKAKKMLEEITGTYISIGLHTVAIIGGFEEVRLAREAILMLIEGRQHTTVYRFLQSEKRRQKYRISL
ncbi:MAG: RNA-processing protein [Thermoprotei archaeon]|nr:MAG: RNA-processing protein [Thermofilum sp. ex4484_79]RLE61308.1 MAG: RNA-processing protein [Thermoprotei archaeon]